MRRGNRDPLHLPLVAIDRLVVSRSNRTDVEVGNVVTRFLMKLTYDRESFLIEK